MATANGNEGSFVIPCNCVCVCVFSIMYQNQKRAHSLVLLKAMYYKVGSGHDYHAANFILCGSWVVCVVSCLPVELCLPIPRKPK